MKPSMLTKLLTMSARHEEIKTLLSDPDVTNDLNRFRDLSREYSQLEPFVQMYASYLANQKHLEEAKQLADEGDAEMQQLARQESKELEEKLSRQEEELLLMLLPKDPFDDNNIFLEIRAGAGGDEAAIFSGDLSRMYTRYAENQGWKIEVISESLGEHGGYKEIIMRVLGQGAYSPFKF